MQGRKAVKWSVLVVLLVLVMVAASPGIPFAQEPQFEPMVPCGDSASCSMAGNAFSVQNSGTGAAIYGRNTSGVSGAGVYGRAQQGAGVRAQSNSGNGMFASSYNTAGVRGRSTFGAGIRAESVNGSGVYIPSAGYHGIHIVSAGFQGVYIENAGLNGVRAHTYGAGIDTAAIRGENPSWDGTGIRGTGGYGVVGSSTDNTWAGYFYDNIYVGGSCTGCVLGYIARNDDSSPLERGDVVAVSGILDPLAGQTTPVFKVQRAAGPQAAIIGVVQARGQVGQSPDGGGAAIKPAEGAAEPNEYLLIVTQGPIQVKAEPSAGIQAGDRLAAGDDGLAILAAPDVQTLGRAVDAVDPATGLVWVLVDLP